MALFRYFAYVGGALLALILMLNVYLPKPVEQHARRQVDHPTIRITSQEVKVPAVFIDTSQPTIIPPPAPAQRIRVEPTPPRDNASVKLAQAEAFAQMKPEAKRAARKPVPKKYAARRVQSRTAMVQPFFFPSFFASW
jgi:hypothetical protein